MRSRPRFGFAAADASFRHSGATAIDSLAAQWPLALAIAGAAAAMAVVAAALCPPHVILDTMREYGPVENATVFWYVAAVAALSLGAPSRFDTASRAASGLLLALCVAKEVSLRRQLLVEGGYDLCCFAVTAWPNLLATLLVLASVPAAAWLLLRHGRAFVSALSRRCPYACSLATAVLCLAVSQAAERLLKVDVGPLALAMHLRPIALSIEEVLEMIAPVLIVLAVLQSRASAGKSTAERAAT